MNKGEHLHRPPVVVYVRFCMNLCAIPIKVKDLLGHRHVTTTQIYDKRRRSTSESASHDLVI